MSIRCCQIALFVQCTSKNVFKSKITTKCCCFRKISAGQPTKYCQLPILS